MNIILIAEPGIQASIQKKLLIKHLGDYGIEANRYIKKNRIKISNQHPEGIIAVINFLNGLY